MSTQKPACDCEAAYIKRIRHSGKLRYARAFHAHQLRKTPAPRPRDFGLGMMGAQAVEWELRARHGDAYARQLLGMPPIESAS